MWTRRRFTQFLAGAATGLLTACGGVPGLPAPASGGGAAPELGLTAEKDWYNSKPLTLAGLRGKPALLVFWSNI